MEFTTTAEQLLDILVKVNDSAPCSECQRFAALLREMILRTKLAESTLSKTEENSYDEKWARNMLSNRVRLEATTSRRFLLHILTEHNR